MTEYSHPTILIALQYGSTAVVDELRRHDLTVLVASNGIEVVSHLFPRGDAYALRPSLLVLSATLPGYNGLSVLAGVRSMGWNTPVVMTWPSSEPWIADEAIRLGCSGLIEEPADPSEIVTKARQLTLTAAPLHKVVAGPTRETAA